MRKWTLWIDILIASNIINIISFFHVILHTLAVCKNQFGVLLIWGTGVTRCDTPLGSKCQVGAFMLYA